MNNRLKWKRAALLLAAGAAAAGGCAWAVQGELTTAWYEVPLPAGLEGLDGVKIAQISDVHSADLEGPLRAALEEAAPDLIVMTGDLVNREDRDLSRALSLARMAAETAPAFFAPGNHEVDSPCWPELRDGLEAAGVQVLEDRAVLRNFRGEAVNLEGLWDLNHDPLGQAHARETLPERIRVLCREGALNVLLSHRPGLLEEYGAGALMWCSADTPTGDRCACRLWVRCSPRTRACFPSIPPGCIGRGRPGWWSAGGWATAPPIPGCGTGRSWWS